MKQSLSTTSFFILTIATMLFMAFLVRAQEPDWLRRVNQQKWMKKVARLKILKTNRVEAKSILGKPDDSGYNDLHSEAYTLSDGQVQIDYTRKECTSVNGKIPIDTIEEISFYFETNILFSKLNLPRKQFKYEPFPDTDGGSYENKQTGISIHVHIDGTINSIHIHVPEQKNFNCVTRSSFLSDLEKVKKIKLFESNREEVRNIFAGYDKYNNYKSSEYIDSFYTSDATFEFSYSEGKCLFDNEDRYGGNEWDVAGVKIYPTDPIDPKEYGIDLTKYKKEKLYQNRLGRYVFYDKDSGISFEVFRGKINEINLFPQRKYYSLMCDKERAKTLSSTESLFAEKLRDRIYDENAKASIDTLNISRKEIISCNSSGAVENKYCLNESQTVNVFTQVKNPFDEPLTYGYMVTGGKIIGKGARVVWDLSGVKPGAYKITAAVDDGCGFCGADKTKTIVVK